MGGWVRTRACARACVCGTTKDFPSRVSEGMFTFQNWQPLMAHFITKLAETALLFRICWVTDVPELEQRAKIGTPDERQHTKDTQRSQ